MKEPDTEHKLLLAEGTLKEIGRILSSHEENAIKIMWLKVTMINYHKHKDQIETQGYISHKIEESE